MTVTVSCQSARVPLAALRAKILTRVWHLPGVTAHRRRRIEPAAFAKRLRRAKEARRYSHSHRSPLGSLVFGAMLRAP